MAYLAITTNVNATVMQALRSWTTLSLFRHRRAASCTAQRPHDLSCRGTITDTSLYDRKIRMRSCIPSTSGIHLKPM